MITIEPNELKVIANIVAENTSVPMFNIYMRDGIKGARGKENVKARQVCMYFAYKLYKHLYSQKLIGLHYGDRDHSTVIHAIEETQNHMSLSKKFYALIEKIEKEINNYQTEGRALDKELNDNIEVLDAVKNQL